MLTREQRRKSLFIKFILLIVIVIAVTIWCQNPQWSYQIKIAQLKEEYPKGYYFFPDRLPESATDISWVQVPSLMQGQGYDALSIKADKEYLDSVVENYGDKAEPAVYWSLLGDWCVLRKDEFEESFDALNNDAEGITYITDVANLDESALESYRFRYVYFPTKSRLRENKDALVYIMHDNYDWNHSVVRGFYIIPSENLICFYNE